MAVLVIPAGGQHRRDRGSGREKALRRSGRSRRETAPALGRMSDMVGCVFHEDEDLLVVDKPAGVNTHAPSPYAGEGIYDWLRNREPRWASLAIIQRLDKDTSGVIVFGKSRRANQSLSAQFEGRDVRKRYRLLTDRAVGFEETVVRSAVVRLGERYVARRAVGGEPVGETRFRVVLREQGLTELEAIPRTGLTHQIRVHAAFLGIPIVGDDLYGGLRSARGLGSRMCLHAAALALRHPATGAEVAYEAPLAGWVREPGTRSRAFVDPAETDAYRVVHGGADGWPGLYVERWGGDLLVQTGAELGDAARGLVEDIRVAEGAARVWEQHLERRLAGRSPGELSPRRVWGPPAEAPAVVRENGLCFEARFDAGYSVGLFLDQRDNRRRLLRNHVASGFPVSAAGLAGAAVLNLFAYTCGFSVAAARAGAVTTSVDLSRPYLEWGRRNFDLNGLNPESHEFLQGDAFDWLRRLGRKGRRFGVVVVDPPTFSRSKTSGVFRAATDYGRLVGAVMPVLDAGGVLLACSNAGELSANAFLQAVREGVARAGRRVGREHYVAQPLDFPVTREEPAHLRTVWCQVD